jgi:Iap family predicted aminopeptidase
MRAYESFEALPNRRGYGVVFRENKKVELTRACFEQVDWSEVAFHSTNSALNLRKSSIVERIEELI